jgi:hypothetical protein
MTRRLAILALLLTALAARAQSVEFRMQERDGWVGSPLVMEIEVQNAADATAPEISATPDFDVRVDPSPRRMEWRQSINGRTTSRSTLVWRVEFTPKREGKFTLPEIVMRSGSQTWRNPPQEVTISSSTANDTLRLEAITDPPSPWVGQSVKLSLRILVRQFTSAQHGVTLDEAQMWRLHDESGCSWGILEPRIRELAQSNRRPAGTEQVIDGKSWIVYEIEAPFTADRAGPVSLGDLRVAWRYPTSLTVGRDFFGSPELTLSGVRPVTATLTARRRSTGVVPRRRGSVRASRGRQAHAGRSRRSDHAVDLGRGSQPRRRGTQDAAAAPGRCRGARQRLPRAQRPAGRHD